MASAVESLPEASAFTPEQLQAALENAGATDVHVEQFTDESTASSRGANARGLPSDLFAVGSSWADWQENGKKHVAFYGRWNYRDDRIGSGAPYDGAAMSLSGFNSKCWRNVSTGLTTQSSDGTHTNLATIKSSNHQKTIFNVHDRTSGFRLLTDMGFAWIDMKRTKAGCGSTKQGRFYHEHNQQGKGGWSATVNLLAFSISYSGNSGERLQKASPISYH